MGDLEQQMERNARARWHANAFLETLAGYLAIDPDFLKLAAMGIATAAFEEMHRLGERWEHEKPTGEHDYPDF